MAEEIVNLPYQSFEYNSNQVPQVTTTSLVVPNIQTCDVESMPSSVGPTAASESDLPVFTAEDIIRTNEPLFKRGLEPIGHSDLVRFHHWSNPRVEVPVVKEVAPYLKMMIDAANADGVPLGVASGFRTSVEQNDYWNIGANNPAAVANFAVEGYTYTFESNGVTHDSLGNDASAPNNSNHQNGIAFDLNVSHLDGRIYEWLVKNAWKYGFIRAVRNERWHWEYWGDWAGQEKPDWAKDTKWGANGHQPKAMFGIIARQHTVRLVSSRWWTNKGAPTPHTDQESGGTAVNTWIGYGNEHLPDKFDREEPGWDTA